MKKTISSNRLTIDLTDESKSNLEMLKEALQKPFGQIVNHTISTICDAPNSVKQETLSFYKRQIKALNEQLDDAPPFERQALIEKIDAYKDLARLMNNGEYISMYDIEKEPELVRYDIKDGYVICPKNYIVINPEMAKESYYAGVVECRRTDYNMPHFLFFTNKKGHQYDNNLYKEINNACCKAWEGFSEILAKQVEPIDDEYGHQLNIEEWEAAPTLGYFPLYEQGDPKLPPDFKFPMGARIVHV